MTGTKGAFRVGTSGWQYDHWRGVLYPKDRPKAQWFACYAEAFDTVEVNNTFYHLPGVQTFDAWHDQAPPGFRYALKFSRYGTHMKKLTDPRETIGAFLERAEKLRGFLGPILVQLPPRWRADPGRLEAFLKAAPRRHRWAFEFRDESWLNDDVLEVLADRRAALCIHDLIDEHPRHMTADWTYLRYHGSGNGPYRGGYSSQALSGWARWIRRQLDDGADVFAFFNNDVGGHAVRNARDLRRFVTDG